jgi:hypothetical protein
MHSSSTAAAAAAVGASDRAGDTIMLLPPLLLLLLLQLMQVLLYSWQLGFVLLQHCQHICTTATNAAVDAAVG